MKKIIASAVTAICLLVSALGFSACAPAEHTHEWNDGEITVQPTCTQEGVKTYTCTVKGCKETYTEAVSMLAHTYNSGEITVQPTCAENGVKTYTCTDCGNTYTEGVDKTEHNWDGGTLTAIPLLTTSGELLYTCADCGETKREVVAPRADFAEQFTTTYSADSEWKYGYARSFDGATGEINFVRILETDENSPSVWKSGDVEISADKISGNAVIAYAVLNDADINFTISFTGEEQATRMTAYAVADGQVITLSEDGKDWSAARTQIAVTAGSNIYFVFENSGEGKPCGSFKLTLTCPCIHIWDDGEVTSEPTCSEDGVKTYSCEKCGAEKYEALTDRPSHNWQQTGIQEPTNEGDGYIFYACDNCGQTKSETIPALNHIKSDTYDYDDDSHWFVCAEHEDCGLKFEQSAHSFTTHLEEEDKAATCEEDGYSVWQCVCGAKEYRPISKEQAEHSYEYEKIDEHEHSATCSVCGDSFTEEHNWQQTDSGDGYIDYECKFCGATKREEQPEEHVHSWDEGVITVQPTLTSDGEIKYTCSCGETVTQPVPAKDSVNYTEEFTIENQDGNWSYGKMDDPWSDNPNFVECDQKTDDAWIANDYGVEIKADWINASSETTIAYTAEAEINVTVKIEFTGGTENTLLAIRVYKADSDGKLVEIILSTSKNEDGKQVVEFGYEFKANETIYIMFSNEKWQDSTANPNGNLDITITKVTEQ